MKTRSLIVRALLLAMLLSPSGLRAFGARVSLSSCHLSLHHRPTAHSKGQTAITAHRLAVSFPNHHGPAQRLHRVRGPRINVETAVVPTPRFSTVGRLPFSDVTLRQQEFEGPNPSRGPPAQFPL